MVFLLDLIVRGIHDKKTVEKTGCTKKLCELTADFLFEQKHNKRLPLVLSPFTKVAHKTGTREGVRNDAGIIFFNNRPLFILSVFTYDKSKLIDVVEIDSFISKLCLLCFDGLKN